ncbi:MAG: SpoIID/LytB domain-containing protein [bacterium]|nr:SpoIID/LytB domain-containing protein [bacterium]
MARWFVHLAAALIVVDGKMPAGAQVAPVPRELRIGVVEGAPRLGVASSRDWAVLHPDGTSLATVSAGPAVAFRVETGALCLDASGSATMSLPPVVRCVPMPEATLSINGRPYRGQVEVRQAESSVVGVNVVDLEAYLYGVVPAESIPSWPLEALKAQAVAARTYALAHLGQFASLGYDLKATVASQVYGGVALERPSTNRAVDETRGRVLTWRDRPIDAVYCDSSGGFTESCRAAWGRDVPYLQPVPDFDQQSPHYAWELTLEAAQVNRQLGRQWPGSGSVEITGIEPVERTETGRARRVRLEAGPATQVVPAERLRSSLGLRSAYWNVERQADGRWHFVGRGWGHGIGMSQWGAKAMADMGFTHAEILAWYYPGTVLTAPPLARLP